MFNYRVVLFDFTYHIFVSVEVKVEVKTEDDQEDTQQDNHRTDQQREPEASAQAEQVKAESDRAGQVGRKRPYEENRGYGYYEHREDKRYDHYPKL